MINNIKFIFFDLGGVFFEWENYFSTAANNFNLNKQDMVNIFKKYSDDITKGIMAPQDFWEKCREEMGIKNGAEYNFLESWVDDYVPLPKMHKLAVMLSNKYGVGVISNIYLGMYEILLAKGKIPDLPFNPKILSCEIGFRKPEKEIFELTQKEVKFQGKEILYIDDTQMYLDAAQQLGWQTFLFQTHNTDESLAKLQSII